MSDLEALQTGGLRPPQTPPRVLDCKLSALLSRGEMNVPRPQISPKTKTTSPYPRILRSNLRLQPPLLQHTHTHKGESHAKMLEGGLQAKKMT